MARDRLGLFDTLPSRNEVRLSQAIVGLLLAALILILPARDIQLSEVGAFIPIIDAIMFVAELITAVLLYAQAAVFRSRALTVLATGYAFAALLLVPHLLTFPGVFSADGLLGAGVNTTAWLYTVRRAAFPIAVIAYVRLKQADASLHLGRDRPGEGIALRLWAAIGLAAAVTLVTTSGHELLPPFYLNHLDRSQPHAFAYHLAALLLYVLAAALLFRKRDSLLDMWLLVALSGWLIQGLLNVLILSRFTIGWYGLFGMMLVADLIIMIALIAETSWLYSRLALSTAARNREREARLMSMDAVTAAIAHEVGQPLTAVKLHASAGLSSLTSPQPDIEKAIRSLREISDSEQRTSDVIKSIRAMFAKGLGSKTEFSINDLARETASLMDRELAAKKVVLELTLDETLPPILANRVQMQRVLVNLFSNAVESFSAAQGQPRRIAIRSAPLNDEDLLVQVSDNGVGITPEEMERIFDPFFTTKAAGTGLGLPLCRTIVEEHGGRLWATAGEDGGATFHVQLPRRS